MSLKKQYIERLEEQLDAWSAEIDGLEAGLQRVAPHLKIFYEERLSPIMRKRDEARRKLQEIESAPSDAWEELKCGTEILWDRLRESMHHAREYMRHPHHAPRIVGKPHPHVYEPQDFAGQHHHRQTRGSPARSEGVGAGHRPPPRAA